MTRKMFPTLLTIIWKILQKALLYVNQKQISVLKEFVSSYYEKLTDIFNNCIRKDTFQETLRKAEVTLVFKKGDPTSKTYYRLVSTVSNYFQTLFKKPIYLKLNDYVQNKLPM